MSNETGKAREWYNAIHTTSVTGNQIIPVESIVQLLAEYAEHYHKEEASDESKRRLREARKVFLKMRDDVESEIGNCVAIHMMNKRWKELSKLIKEE